MGSLFVWHTFDVRGMLPAGWRESVVALARERARVKVIAPTSMTSREHRSDLEIPTHIVGGRVVAAELPWLRDLYLGTFRDLAQRLNPEPVSPAGDVHVGLNLHVQQGSTERYECHVDSNPIAAMLYATAHPLGAGGELVVSNRGDVRGRDLVDEDAACIYPVPGHLFFFDAREHTHYVAPLREPGSIRVAVVMTFYIPSSPEERRPADLNHHLGLD